MPSTWIKSVVNVKIIWVRLLSDGRVELWKCPANGINRDLGYFRTLHLLAESCKPFGHTVVKWIYKTRFKLTRYRAVNSAPLHSAFFMCLIVSKLIHSGTWKCINTTQRSSVIEYLSDTRKKNTSLKHRSAWRLSATSSLTSHLSQSHFFCSFWSLRGKQDISASSFCTCFSNLCLEGDFHPSWFGSHASRAFSCAKNLWAMHVGKIK